MEQTKHDYEKQLLLEFIGAVINGEEPPRPAKEPDWQALYKDAYFHHVANTVYIALIGMTAGETLAEVRPLFEEAYTRAHLLEEAYTQEAVAIYAMLERCQVHCMESEERVLARYYDKLEQRMPTELVIQVEAGDQDLLRQEMARLGYQPRKGAGRTIRRRTNGKEHANDGRELRFVKEGGIYVTFREDFGFRSKAASKYFDPHPGRWPKVPGFSYIHHMVPADFYLYDVTRMAERFTRGELEIKDVADLWMLYLAAYEAIDWKEANQAFRTLKIDGFAAYIVKLAALWFGEQAFPEDARTLGAMQDYILSKGREGRDDSEAIIPLEEVVSHTHRNLRREERRRNLRLLFPEAAYMEAMYPTLSLHPRYLPFCWVHRLTSQKVRRWKARLGKKA